MDLKAKQKHYRISPEEYNKISELLGRPPEGIEWALFSALWSEHCSYKSSRVHLKKLYNQSDRVLEAFGENAGVVDLGQGERVAFKMESHNHPSYIEPYQGAATGVGGILRDIFTMGARPIALGNYLCFGQADADRMPTLVDGVVRGIGGYGNCVGVPNVTGQTEFHSSYDGNILVNAFALGYFGKDDVMALSQAKGVGNLLVYVGAKTGKDGVHGASMASESFDEDSESKKPNVQIGDPFFEKCLIESCLEVISSGLVEAIQDMGAAGLTSSSFEMASKGQVGLRMVLDQVPIRDESITPEEILLSESQERMLLVCKPEKFEELQVVFHRWGLDASVIGEVLAEKKIEIIWKGEELTTIDPDMLVENAPAYQREYSDWMAKNRVSSSDDLNCSNDVEKYTTDKLQAIQGASKEWIYRQYDQRVGAATERDCSSPVGVVRLPESQRRLGVVLGCRPAVMRFDAYVGGIDSVAYPCLELASLGFRALAMTDCLNFGNPEKKEIMSEFVASLNGMNQMARAVETPIISGNVSFYNETLGENITSTPSTGLVGLREDRSDLPQSSFTEEGHKVFLVRCSQLEVCNEKGLGELDIEKTSKFIRAVESYVLNDKPSSARVVGKYGLEYALSRMSFKGVGAEVKYDRPIGREYFYEVLFATSSSNEVLEKAFDGFEVIELGKTIKDSLVMNGSTFNVSSLADVYKKGWQEAFKELT